MVRCPGPGRVWTSAHCALVWPLPACRAVRAHPPPISAYRNTAYRNTAWQSGEGTRRHTLSPGSAQTYPLLIPSVPRTPSAREAKSASVGPHTQVCAPGLSYVKSSPMAMRDLRRATVSATPDEGDTARGDGGGLCGFADRGPLELASRPPHVPHATTADRHTPNAGGRIEMIQSTSPGPPQQFNEDACACSGCACRTRAGSSPCTQATAPAPPRHLCLGNYCNYWENRGQSRADEVSHASAWPRRGPQPLRWRHFSTLANAHGSTSSVATSLIAPNTSFHSYSSAEHAVGPLGCSADS